MVRFTTVLSSFYRPLLNSLEESTVLVSSMAIFKETPSLFPLESIVYACIMQTQKYVVHCCHETMQGIQ